jgi:hypothetical protein
MVVLNDDKSIYITRGDAVTFPISYAGHTFQPGEVVRFKVYGKKDAKNVVLQKDFPVTEECTEVEISLTSADTKIGEVISKPTDYWYEVELNPFDQADTFIGYGVDGAAVFKLFPEGDDVPEFVVEPEDIPVVDKELDMTSTRPVQNQAVARAVASLRGAVDKTDAKGADTANELAVERARIDNLVSGASAGDAEVVDIRVGADGVTYASAGTAVRGQFADVNALKAVLDIDFVTGTISNGIESDHAGRAKFVQKVKACRTVVSLPASSVYLYGYVTYDENGDYDGVDHGWNAMDGKPLRVDSGYFKMNFRKVADSNMTAEDLEALKAMIVVGQFNILFDIDDIKTQLAEGTATILPYEVELGSLTAGEKVAFTTRARFVEKVRVGAKTVATIAESEKYLYGYFFYDEAGVYDGVDHGWNSPGNQPTVTFEDNGYVMFNFRRTDAGEITEEDLAAFASFVTIVSRKSVVDVDADVKALAEKVGDSPERIGALTSIGVEYGRVHGASYVFARIPKTTHAGRNLRPKLHLTSADGSLDGSKVSALSFAKRNDAIFTMNAGLFNTQTLQPVGQTIINGVSYVNVPMTDDMGTPISDQECYPLCIDADGNLSAPYNRGVDTAEMIADGVMYAVTGWGKVIDNFAPCSDTVKNEIVHGETYIRQVIGQFQNGDYCVCTVDKSRGSIENEAGLTYADLAQLLVDKGVKFAYSLDGGGSAETVIGLRQLNPIYEGVVGRSVPTVITFEY